MLLSDSLHMLLGDLECVGDLLLHGTLECGGVLHLLRDEVDLGGVLLVWLHLGDIVGVLDSVLGLDGLLGNFGLWDFDGYRHTMLLGDVVGLWHFVVHSLLGVVRHLVLDCVVASVL